MKKSWEYIVLVLSVFIILMMAKNESSAQKTDAFARVSVSPREGVVRQSYKVTITVHSSTWFAKPLQFANLRIDDAFIIPFTRTVSSINYINNKKYATLSFYYLVFPYNTGNLEIPELEISASIPPEGGYKGEPVTIRTKAQKIKVNPIPSSKDETVWMVAKNVSIIENWNKPIDNLKVGDVIEREITITANGTLPSLIQPFKIEQPELTSIYPKEPDLQDKRNNEDVNGVRIERYSYLFEEEGEITIPEEELLWWNPQTKRAYKRTLPEKTLSIAANPDLAMMESLKDSLMALSAPTELEAEEETLPWLRIAFIVFVLVFIGYFGTKAYWAVSTRIKTKRAAYLQSEAYYFKEVLQALNRKSTKEFIRALYVWFDKARKHEQTAAINYFLNSKEQEKIEKIVQDCESRLTPEQTKKLGVLLENLRVKVLNPSSGSEKEMQLNPG
ncbi:BatD family protein [Draconibacterium sp.]|nr:BatD family protein [Draconibacterium sp.]